MFQLFTSFHKPTALQTAPCYFPVYVAMVNVQNNCYELENVAIAMDCNLLLIRYVTL